MRHTAGLQQYGAFIQLDDGIQDGERRILRGKTEPPCVFDGLVYVYALAVFPILVGGTSGAHVAAVLVDAGFRYIATLEELLRPQPAALMRTVGLRYGKHHVTDTEVFGRTDTSRSRLEVHEVHEIAARNIVELVFVAYPVDELLSRYRRVASKSSPVILALNWRTLDIARIMALGSPRRVNRRRAFKCLVIFKSLAQSTLDKCTSVSGMTAWGYSCPRM